MITIGVIIFTSWALYDRTSQILDANLRERLLSIVTTASTEFDSNDVEQLHVEEDWKKPEWAKVVHQMEKIRKNNSKILFVYMFRKSPTDPKNMEFVADSHSIDPYAKMDINNDGVIDDGDQLNWPGQPYDVTDIPETFEAYNGPTTNKDIYSDQWGPVLTGYSPIKDASGTVVAILAVDIKAGDFAIITSQTLQPFIIFIVVLSFIITLLLLTVIFFWNRNANYLKSLDKLKTEFLSLATHQLQSPLTSIIGYVSLLLEGIYGNLEVKQKEVLGNILDASKSLSHVIDDFLNVSKIESGGMRYEKIKFDFDEIVSSIVKELSIVAERKGMKIVYVNDKKGPYTVFGDKEKLKQVVLNLTDNAIKYSKQGTIKIEVGKIGRGVIFAVKDNGIGISKEGLATLFQKFARGSGSKMNTKGSGIGLYLAKEIAVAHGGAVWAESEGEGKGSVFFINLPMA